MPYCTNCGTEIQADARFCQACGRAQGRDLQAQGTELRYRISPSRIVVMSVLSWSLYLFYWLYITWKHYRDHTGQQVYPVWHAIAAGVPIYGYFRVHAHARSFKELMTNANVETTINPGWAVFAVVIYSVLSGVGNGLAFGAITEGVAFALFVIDILSVIIVAWLLGHLQGNLNRYWDSVSSLAVADARIGVGEVIIAVLGLLAWADTIATLFSPAYRSGY